MQENPTKIWEVADSIYDTIDETTVGQMNDLIGEFGLFAEAGDFSADEAKNIFDFVVEKDSELGSMLQELGYHQEEVTEPALARLKLCLMTRHFVDAQNNRDKTEDRSDIRDLCVYNSALRDMMALHPDMSLKTLEDMLITTLMWSGTPIQRSRSEDRLIRRTIHGARGELAMQQFAASPYAEQDGIVAEETTIEQDLKGIDVILNVPVTFNDTNITMRLKIDVKNDLKTVKASQWSREEKNYSFDRDRVLMWSHLTEEEYGDKLALSEEQLHTYSQLMAKECQQAATDKARRNAVQLGLVAVAA